MTASYEWTEYHLTPRGWESGSEKTDFGCRDVSPPVDRVMSVRYIQEHNGYSMGDRFEETFRASDEITLEGLRRKFGQPPQSL